MIPSIRKYSICQIEFFIGRTLSWKLESLPAAVREPLRAAYQTVDAERSAEQKALLKKYPSVREIKAKSLYLYDREYNQEISKRSAERKKKAAEAAGAQAGTGSGQ